MSTYMGGARTAVLASFPFNPVSKIVGKPSNTKVSKWFRQMCSNLILVTAHLEVGCGKGHLGMLQQDGVFQARNSQAYNLPLFTPTSTPVFPTGSTSAQGEEIEEIHKVDVKNYDIYKAAGRCSVDIGARAFEDWVFDKLNYPTEGLAGVTIRQFLDYIKLNYVKATQEYIYKNLVIFNQGIDASNPLAVYTRKQEICQEIAEDSNIPISATTIVSTDVKHAVATGGMETTWREWKIIEVDPAQASDWSAWKEHWKSRFQTKCKLVALIGISYNGTANQAAEQDQADNNIGDRMVNALDSLANAAVLKT